MIQVLVLNVKYLTVWSATKVLLAPNAPAATSLMKDTAKITVRYYTAINVPPITLINAKHARLVSL